jgi:hypothetical protein
MRCSKIGVLLVVGLGVFSCTGSGTIGQKSELATGQPCEVPGAKAPMADGCNECTCGADATWACTDVACGESCEDDGVVHAHGTSWPCSDGCNTCFCENGRTGGTLIGCGEPACTPGEQRQAGDECNVCECDERGRWDCTELVCGAHCSMEGVAAFVAHGTSFHTPDDCRDCNCEHGVVTCTDGGGCESCKLGSVEYAHGESWQCDCNTCNCDNGQVGSTLVFCSECVTGEIKVADDLCNTCRCEAGQWACTFKDCSSHCDDASDCEPLDSCTELCDPPGCRQSACLENRCAIVETPCFAQTCTDDSDCPDSAPSEECLSSAGPCWGRRCIDDTCVGVTPYAEWAL